MLNRMPTAIEHESWRKRPWAIVLLVLLAVAFGAQAAIVGLTFLTLSTCVLLMSWVSLLVMSLPNRTPTDHQRSNS